MRRVFKLLVLVCAINFVTARHVRRDVEDDNDDEDTVKKVAVEDEKLDDTTDTVSDKSDNDVRHNFVQFFSSPFFPFLLPTSSRYADILLIENENGIKI